MKEYKVGDRFVGFVDSHWEHCVLLQNGRYLWLDKDGPEYRHEEYHNTLVIFEKVSDALYSDRDVWQDDLPGMWKIVKEETGDAG
jgi:hypothetical protein